jgi:hypothetical protein
VLPHKEHLFNTFEGYDIHIYVQAIKVRSLTGTNSFRVTIKSGFRDKVGEVADAAQVGALVIDSLAIELTDNDSLIHLALFATDVDDRTAYPSIRGKRLLGPSYRYELVEIPDGQDSIRVSYICKLVFRKSGRNLETGRFSQTLHRFDRLEYY